MYNICFVPTRKSAHFLLGQPKPWFNFAVVMLAEWGRHSQSSSWPQGCGMLLHPQDGLGGPAADLYFQQCRIPTQRQLMTSDKKPWPPFLFTFFSLPIPGAILGVELNSCIVPILESSRKKNCSNFEVPPSFSLVNLWILNQVLFLSIVGIQEIFDLYN